MQIYHGLELITWPVSLALAMSLSRWKDPLCGVHRITWSGLLLLGSFSLIHPFKCQEGWDQEHQQRGWDFEDVTISSGVLFCWLKRRHALNPTLYKIYARLWWGGVISWGRFWPRAENGADEIRARGHRWGQDWDMQDYGNKGHVMCVITSHVLWHVLHTYSWEMSCHMCGFWPRVSSGMRGSAKEGLKCLEIKLLVHMQMKLEMIAFRNNIKIVW